MNYFWYSLMIFILSVLLHILICRFFDKLQIRSFKSVLIFPLGLFILILPNPWKDDFILTPVAVYILFSIIWSLLFISVYYRDVSPTFKILSLAGRKKRFSLKEVTGIFSDRELIFNRLEGLISSGQIKKNKDSYYVTAKGVKLIFLINIYRKILNWNQGG